MPVGVLQFFGKLTQLCTVTALPQLLSTHDRFTLLPQQQLARRGFHPKKLEILSTKYSHYRIRPQEEERKRAIRKEGILVGSVNTVYQLWSTEYYYKIRMNRLQISLQGKGNDESTWGMTYTDANRYLAVLRSDHFRVIRLSDVTQVAVKDLKFLIQLTRLLKSEGEVVLDSAENGQLNALLKALNLHEGESTEHGKHFLRSPPQQPQQKQTQKLAIGFYGVEKEKEEQINEDELLEGEGITLSKQAEACETKPRACANCSCGRKDTETKVSKEELVKAVNEGKPVSGCGKCFLGDSFRCGTCPYKGLPAFKPGDRLKLEEDGGVQVEQAATFVSAGGKVKLEL